MNRSTSIFSERSDSTNIYQSSVDLSPNGIDLNRQVSVQNESKKNEPKYTKSAGKKYAKNDKNDKKRRMKKSQSIDLKETHFLGGNYNLNEIADRFAEKLEVLEEEEIAEQKKMMEANPNAFTIYEGSSNPSDELQIHPGRICCTSLTKGISKVKPIGWMAIFGDGIGNFIDGLSIGASINQSVALGITNAIAAWFGNIPQELGDFALLVRAGMTPFQALFYNYMSGNAAYIGCAIGILFGENIRAARWIFSISAATTMYLGLAVLLPELNEEFEDENESFSEKLKITFFQLFGMVTGITIMVCLNLYEDDFNF